MKAGDEDPGFMPAQTQDGKKIRKEDKQARDFSPEHGWFPMRVEVDKEDKDASPCRKSILGGPAGEGALSLESIVRSADAALNRQLKQQGKEGKSEPTTGKSDLATIFGGDD